jgi:hypothetical protein
MENVFIYTDIPEKKEFQSLIDQYWYKNVLLSESGNRSYLTFYRDVAQDQITEIFNLLESRLHINKGAVHMRKDEQKTVVMLEPLMGLPTDEELQMLYDDIVKII